MLHFLPLLLLLAGAGPAAACTGTGTPVPTSVVPASVYVRALPAGPPPARAVPPGPCTAADTVQALHCLFQHQRHKGSLVVGISTATHVALAVFLGIRESNSYRRSRQNGGGGGSFVSGPLLQFGVAGYLLVLSLIFVPITIAGIRYTVAYGVPREKKIVGRYETTGRLAARFRQRVARYLP